MKGDIEENKEEIKEDQDQEVEVEDEVTQNEN